MSFYGDFRERKKLEVLDFRSSTAQFCHLQLKIGMTSYTLLEQATYGFEVLEVTNPRLQTDHNSKLKRENYNRLNQGYVESIVVLRH